MSKEKEIKEEEVIEEVFNEYDEPVFTEEQELEMYGDKPEDATLIPQTHEVEENYEASR